MALILCYFPTFGRRMHQEICHQNVGARQLWLSASRASKGFSSVIEYGLPQPLRQGSYIIISNVTVEAILPLCCPEFWRMADNTYKNGWTKILPNWRRKNFNFSWCCKYYQRRQKPNATLDFRIWTYLRKFSIYFTNYFSRDPNWSLGKIWTSEIQHNAWKCADYIWHFLCTVI